MSDQTATAGSNVPAPPADTPTTPLAPVVAPFAPGQIVRYTYEDNIDGTTTKVGIVTSVLDGGLVTVGWLVGESGPIAESELRAA